VWAPPNFQGRGTIVGGVNSAVCPSPGGSTLGFSTVFYAPLLRPSGDPEIGSLQHYGATLVP
jgi:hypothetical protein